MKDPTPTTRPGLWPLIAEGWIALVLAAFLWLRIAGSATAQRIAHSLFGR